MRGFSHRTRKDAGVHLFSARTSLEGECSSSFIFVLSLIANPAPKLPLKILKHSSSSAGTLSFANVTYFQLIFFGSRGYTSPLSATSEGESYLRFARVMGLLPPAGVFTRATTEDAALDSFQNVLFSIARFRELTGVYPTRITIVGHNFKRRRFEQLHRHALHWPKLHFTYEGVPLGSEADEREAASGEVRTRSFFLGLCISDPIFCFVFFRTSWSTRSHRTLQTCMAVTCHSSRSAQVGIFTRGPTDITLARQKCASCWSGARRMARGSFLMRFRGQRNRRSQLRPLSQNGTPLLRISTKQA